MPLGPRTRVLLIAAVVFAALAALVSYLSLAYWSQPVTPLPPPRQTEESATPQATAPPATPSPQPTPSRPQGPPGDAGGELAWMRLLIPVAGVRPTELRDPCDEAGSE